MILPSGAAAGAATNAFIQWCTAQGIETCLELQGTPPYRYMTCTQDLTPYVDDDTNNNNRIPLVQVPLSTCLLGNTPSEIADRLTFEQMRGEDSDFAPYLAMLPPPLEDSTSSLLQLPRFWSDARLSSVANWDGGQLEARMEAAKTKDEEALVDAWALACVKSRANYLDDGTLSLTPLLDMINHDASVTTKAKIISADNKQNTDKAIELSVLNQSFKAGQEIFMSYGDLTNLDTLVEYGFVVDDNPCNVECLDVRLILSPEPVTVGIAADGTIAPEALALLRQLLASPEEKASRGQQQLAEYMEPLSDATELEVVSFLATELDMSSKDARRGALEAATVREDPLVTSYLSTRAKTLEKAIDTIKERFPDLEY